MSKIKSIKQSNEQFQFIQTPKGRSIKYQGIEYFNSNELLNKNQALHKSYETLAILLNYLWTGIRYQVIKEQEKQQIHCRHVAWRIPQKKITPHWLNEQFIFIVQDANGCCKKVISTPKNDKKPKYKFFM